MKSKHLRWTTMLGAVTLFGLVGTTRAAHAQAAWSSIASGCVLESTSVARATTNAVFGTVSFKGTSKGTIRLTCPVTVPIHTSSATFLNVNYYDPDGAGTACSVKAFLLRTNLDELERGNTIVGFDSNTGASITEPGTGRSRGFVFIPEALNSSAHYYWVDLELSRSATTCNPTAVGTHIIFGLE